MKHRLLIIIASILFVSVATQAAPSSDWSQPENVASAYTSYNASDKTITIGSEMELARLSDQVNRGTNYAGWTITLDVDLDMSAHYWIFPIGRNQGEYYMFMGTFDGQGHTISGLYYNWFYESDNLPAGLFGMIGTTAIVKNLTVQDSEFPQSEVGGIIVGHNKGHVENCHVGSNVTIVMGSDGSHNMGGLVGLNEGTIAGCSSCATLDEGGYGGTNFGGIVGYNYGGTIQDCLFMGSLSVSSSSENVGSIVGLCDGGALTHNYYTDSSIATGYHVEGTAPTYNEGAVLARWVTVEGNSIIYGGPATTIYGTGTSMCIIIYPNGMTLNNKFYYTDDSSVIFFASGSGTSSDPYLISSTTEWNKMVTSFSLGYCAGKYFEQTEDITVTTMVGTETYPFVGTYDGGGKTLTFNQGSSSSNYTGEYCAPFHYTGNSDIISLHVTGDIYTAGKFAASLVGFAYDGTTYIENCRSTAAIHSNINGDGSHGGLVGKIQEATTVTFRGCSFAGSLIGSDTYNWGGFVGWCRDSGIAKIRDCVFAPNTISINNSYVNNANFVRNEVASISITAGYYIKMIDSVGQGNDAYSLTTNTEGLTLALADITSSTSYDVSDLCFVSSGFVMGGTIYMAYGAGGISINITTSEGYDYISLMVNPGTLSGTGNPYSYTIPRSNAVISATVVEASDFAGQGTEDDPYVIASTANWNKLVARTNRAETFSGKYFVLSNDITVSTTVADYLASPFSGTFSGQGHTLTASVSDTRENTAPFRHVSDATIRDLVVAGSVTGGLHTAGLVGATTGGTNHIRNCHVSVAITSSGNSTNGAHAGGIVGHGKEATLSVRGCLFDGSIRATATASDTYAGSIVGWCNSATNISTVDCVENATYTNFSHAGFNYDKNQSATAVGTTNCYHFKNWGEVRRARVISSATEELTFENYGTATPYTVAGFTSFNPGFMMDNINYGGKGDNLLLKLTIPDGYAYATLNTSNGTLSNTGYATFYNLLLANDADATLTATLKAADWASTGAGTEESPYLIYNTMQMDKFANEVNTGTTYAGTFFKMMADITYDGTVNNFTPIGNRITSSDTYQFLGSFDGAGHTISGINMTYTGNDNYADSYVGLFGHSYSSSYDAGTIKNLTVRNSSFTGYKYVGAIMGNAAGARIENCHVGSDVTVAAVTDGAKYHGGIAGQAYFGGYVHGCTSAASVTAPITTHNYGANVPTVYSLGEYFGGIVGSNAAATGVVDCLYLGTTVQGQSSVGAIMGYTNGDDTGIQERNFYRGMLTYYGDDASTSHIASNVGWGFCNGEGPADGNGAKRCFRRISAPADLGNLVTTYGEDDYVGIVAYENGLYYNGAYYTENRLSLNDNADNSTVLAENEGDVDVVISGRTLKKDGTWTTLCLPFNVDLTDPDSPLYGATVKRLMNSSLNNGELKINFYNATTIEAGKPYFVKWNNGSTVTNPTFDGVTIVNTLVDVTSTYANFKGCLNPVNLSAGDGTALYFDEDGAKINCPVSDTTIGAFRAYFELNGVQAYRDFTSCVVNLNDATLYGKFLVGDVDGDGELTVIDIQTLVAMVLAGDDATDASDLNSDGVLHMGDVATLVKLILNR